MKLYIVTQFEQMWVDIKKIEDGIITNSSKKFHIFLSAKEAKQTQKSLGDAYAIFETEISDNMDLPYTKYFDCPDCMASLAIDRLSPSKLRFIKHRV